MKKEIKFEEIFEGHLVADNKNWTCEIDGEQVELSIHIETIDMDSATGEPEFNDYPFISSFSIVAHSPHESFDESEEKEPGRLGLIYDAVSYMGGVPIDHKLYDIDALNENLMGELKAKDAFLKTHKAEFGTLAAQQGKGASITYPQFKELEHAEAFAKHIIEKYADTVMSLVGFTLDQPINMMGDDGWGIISHMVSGER